MTRPSGFGGGGRGRSRDPSPFRVETRAERAIPAGTPSAAHRASAPTHQQSRLPEGRRQSGRPDVRKARSRTARLQSELAERTADMQRIKAEYDNYRKRVRRDRLAVGEIAVANVLRGLLPVLDAIARGRALGEVNGGFRQVAKALESELAALGLRAFGEAGEPFDPERHEAVLHEYSAGVDGPTCTEILAPGYRVGEHLLRPARVTVTEPPDPSGGPAAGPDHA